MYKLQCNGNNQKTLIVRQARIRIIAIVYVQSWTIVLLRFGGLSLTVVSVVLGGGILRHVGVLFIVVVVLDLNVLGQRPL